MVTIHNHGSPFTTKRWFCQRKRGLRLSILFRSFGMLVTGMLVVVWLPRENEDLALLVNDLFGTLNNSVDITDEVVIVGTNEAAVGVLPENATMPTTAEAPIHLHVQQQRPVVEEDTAAKSDQDESKTTATTKNNSSGASFAEATTQRQHKLPEWMEDYFKWHRQQRSKLTPENWNKTSNPTAVRFKYLILRCLNEDKICGGTSDRLQSLPYQLLMAHLHRRILLIYWERPFPLEEFLLPPSVVDGGVAGGLDWRVPPYMVEHLREHYLLKDNPPLTFADNAAKILSSRNQKLVVWTRDQTHNHGKAVYNQYHERNQHPSRFETVFHDAWRRVLTPAPPVQRQIDDWMETLGLVPGEYASAHVRALYGVHNRSLEQITEWTQNAIRCSTQLRPEGPFFFGSDSTDAQRAALEYGREQGLRVVSRFHQNNESSSEPLHLETNAQGKVPSDYYDIFVDLYLLGNSRGVAYNVGGYGKMGLIMGFDSDAGIQHQRGGVPWKNGVTAVRIYHCPLKRPSNTTKAITVTAATAVA